MFDTKARYAKLVRDSAEFKHYEMAKITLNTTLEKCKRTEEDIKINQQTYMSLIASKEKLQQQVIQNQTTLAQSLTKLNEVKESLSYKTLYLALGAQLKGIYPDEIAAIIRRYCSIKMYKYSGIVYGSRYVLTCCPGKSCNKSNQHIVYHPDAPMLCDCCNEETDNKNYYIVYRPDKIPLQKGRRNFYTTAVALFFHPECFIESGIVRSIDPQYLRGDQVTASSLGIQIAYTPVNLCFVSTHQPPGGPMNTKLELKWPAKSEITRYRPRWCPDCEFGECNCLWCSLCGLKGHLARKCELKCTYCGSHRHYSKDHMGKKNPQYVKPK